MSSRYIEFCFSGHVLYSHTTYSPWICGSYFILKEHIKLWQWISILISIIGALGSREHHLTIINYFMIFAIAGSFLFIHHWRMPIGIEWFWVAGIGVLGLIGQIFLTRAYCRSA